MSVYTLALRALRRSYRDRCQWHHRRLLPPWLWVLLGVGGRLWRNGEEARSIRIRKSSTTCFSIGVSAETLNDMVRPHLETALEHVLSTSILTIE